MSDEGFYHKDLKSAAEVTNGFETVTMKVPVDMNDMLIAINHFSGEAVKGVSGEIRLAIGDKTYGKEFHIKSRKGDSGKGTRKTIEARSPANTNWLVIEPKKILGL